MEELVIVGSRRLTRSRIDTMAPMDVIDVGQLNNQAAIDMNSMLRTFVPAFNVNQQPISDAATLVRPANLRGLPPDMTVVLVNGKRRHRAAVITFIGGGVSDGAQGADLSVIPSIALSRVEVLRDGAAAQYGADAIAGVMNFALKDAPDGVTLSTQYGRMYEGDGEMMKFAGNWGIPLTDSGFLNLSAEYSTSDPTDRSVQRADAAELITGGNLAVRDPAQVWGRPSVTDNVKLFFNSGFDINDKVHTYLFGNYAHRSVLGGFYFRNPDTRPGVFAYEDDAGNLFRLVGDLTPDDGVDCPIVPVGDNVLLQQVIDDPNCFVFNEMFPGGFTPQFGGDIDDVSLVAGIKGQFDSGLRWDLSAGVGQSNVVFVIKNTVNASLGPQTPVKFNPGAYRQVDQNLNLDLAYPLEVGFYSPINIAGGFEYRDERFIVTEGDRKSFEIGPLFDQGFSIGSNGFPGFGYDQEGSFTRRNLAGYLDLESDIFSRWRVGLAGRTEHFDSFGTTATAKASTRVKLFEEGTFLELLALRGTANTGFRAPTPGQANVTNVTTIVRPLDNTLVNRGTIPPTNPIAMSKGGKELEPERSLNFSGGLIAKFFEFLTLTGDFYYIKVKDRISQSATQILTPEEALALEESGVPGASDLDEFRYYTNAFDTITTGVDLISTISLDWSGAGQTGFTLAYNWNKTKVDDYITGVIDEQRIFELEHWVPRHRFVGSVTHTIADLQLLGRFNYYGSFMDPQSSYDFLYGSQYTVDAELSYTIVDTFTAVFGVENLLDSYPDEQDNMTLLGNRYPQNAPSGAYGGFWYARLDAHF